MPHIEIMKFSQNHWSLLHTRTRSLAGYVTINAKTTVHCSPGSSVGRLNDAFYSYWEMQTYVQYTYVPKSAQIFPSEIICQCESERAERHEWTKGKFKYIFSLARRQKFGKYLCEKSMEKIFMSFSWRIQSTT
jgi:hypothetical protein